MHCVDLGEGFPTSIYLQKSASIQPDRAWTPRRQRALGRRAATDATHDAADAGTAGPARPPALGAGRATAWLAGPASARGPRVPRSRRGVGSPHDRRGPRGTSATSGAGREARRRLAGGACNGSHPVSRSAPKQRRVVSRVCPHSRIAAVSLAEFVAVHIVLVKLPVAILTHQQFRVKYYYSQSSFRTPPVPSVFGDNPVYRRRRRRERAS